VVSENASRSDYRPDAGFSLVELMVAIVVLAIVLAIGIPSFQSMFESSRENRANDDFISAVNLARSEAITRELPAGGRVVLCERNGGATGCSGDTGWGDGLLVAEVDAAGNVVQVIRAWDPVPNASVTAGAARILFASDGRADPAGGFSVNVEGRTSHSYCMRPTGSVFKGACP